MLVTLKCLSTGSIFADMVQTFDRSPVNLSAIFFTTVMIMQRKVKEKISYLNQYWWRQKTWNTGSREFSRLLVYTQRSLLCWMETFLISHGQESKFHIIPWNIFSTDLILRGQRSVYSGKSKTHAIKHLALTLPSGYTHSRLHIFLIPFEFIPTCVITCKRYLRTFSL